MSFRKLIGQIDKAGKVWTAKGPAMHNAHHTPSCQNREFSPFCLWTNHILQNNQWQVYLSLWKFMHLHCQTYRHHNLLFSILPGGSPSRTLVARDDIICGKPQEKASSDNCLIRESQVSTQPDPHPNKPILRQSPIERAACLVMPSLLHRELQHPHCKHWPTIS